MKKTASKGFREFDGYDLGAGRVQIEYKPQKESAFGSQYWGISIYDNWTHTLPSDWGDEATPETLFHEINEFLIMRADLKNSIPKEVVETIMSVLGTGYAEIAKRNPEFWASLSLKGD